MESLKSCSFGCKALPCWHPGSLRYPGEVSKLQITCACAGKLVYPVKLVWVCHSLFWRISGKYPYPPPLHGWTFRLDPHHLFEFPYVLYNSPKPLESFVTYSRFAVNNSLQNGIIAHFKRIFTLKRSARIFGSLFSGWNFRKGKFWSL